MIYHVIFMLHIANVKDLSLLNILSPQPTTSAEKIAPCPTLANSNAITKMFDVKDLVPGIT